MQALYYVSRLAESTHDLPENSWNGVAGRQVTVVLSIIDQLIDHNHAENLNTLGTTRSHRLGQLA
jgi:hypothetical protein